MPVRRKGVLPLRLCDADGRYLHPETIFHIVHTLAAARHWLKAFLHQRRP
jgi:hypothetical protein